MVSSTTRNQTGQPVNRRDWLKVTWAALAGLAALEIGGATLAYTQPRLADGEFGGVIIAGVVDNFPPGSVTHVPTGRFYLVRRDDGGFLALHQRCTHLGCSVPWDQTKETFVCPCHNSEFTSQGEVLNPPAPRPMDLFAVTIQDGQVQVDTSQPVSRQGFETSQVVYP